MCTPCTSRHCVPVPEISSEKNSQTKSHAGPAIYDLSDYFSFEFLLCGLYLIFLLKNNSETKPHPCDT